VRWWLRRIARDVGRGLPAEEDTMKIHHWQSILTFALLVTVASSTALAQSVAPGVTDFSGAKAEAIEASDITTALAVARGTRIEPSAPPTVRLPIFFEFNSAELRPEGRALLDKVGAALSSDELATFRFSVEGHTDSVGSEGYNSSLSTQRAEAVQAYLEAQGVPPERLGTIGHGESAPVADNDTDGGRQRNRRVELINLGGIE
jgi:outer membrane protein OmpA-like peptidoglycan-associated protein